MMVEDVVKGTGGAIGLALGSGGARGLAHLGVLEFLEEKGIRPTVVAGASMGAIVGAAYAAGRLDDARRVVDNLDVTRAAGLFIEFGVHRSGFIEGRRVMEFLARFIPDVLIEDLPIRFAALATDIETGEAVVIDRGKLLTAVRASLSIPGLFTPVRRGRRLLVDGGLSSPVPVATARKLGAGNVVAVNVDNAASCPYNTRRLPKVVDRAIDLSDRIRAGIRRNLPASMPVLSSALSGLQTGVGLFDVMLKTMRICEDRIAHAELAATLPDLLVEPPVGDIATLDFTRADDAVRAGHDAAAAAWPA